jgi:hypothetical protein
LISAKKLGPTLAMVFHWVGNYLFQMIFLVMAALGAG